MGFLVPIFTTVLSAVGLGGVASWLGGSTILAGLARFGLGLAAKYLIGSLIPQPKQQAQTSQLETAYGEDLARSVAMGKVGTAGHLVYRNAYGSGNRRVQDVYILSNFRINGVTRVRYKGEWHNLDVTEDATKGRKILDIDSDVWVKIYNGTMDQTADAGLIANANPAGRWTTDHRGAGIAYAIVTSYLTRDHLQQPWDAFFEVEGAPLYDWRKDSSIGGSGSHRWNDQSTWEFTENPILMAYALERGIFNGTEMMVGKNVSASRLPIAEWTIAANICDETVGDPLAARYAAGLIPAAGSGVTHDQNMQPLLEACAATWVEDATGEYPIVGAAQSIVLTFTDDDIMVDEPFRFSVKRTKSELINTLSGTYFEPTNFYEQTPFAVRVDAPALAEDGERLAVSIPLDAVNSSVVADRLADIQFKASRYQANGEICIHPRFLADARVGRWVEWDSTAFGTRTFQITEKRLGPFGEKATRNIYLTLQEVGEGIFDGTAYVTVPTEAESPGDPDYAASASNFRAAAVLLQVDSAQKSALRFSWDAFDDVTVTAVDVEYRPTAVAVTVSIANPGVITWPSHNLTAGDIFYLDTTGALPTGLTANSPLYVKTVLSSAQFTAALTPDGDAIVTTGTQSGVHNGYVDSITKRAEVPIQVLTVNEGILPNKQFLYRHRIVTSPPRTTFYTNWTAINTLAETSDVSVGLAQQQQDMINYLASLSAGLQETRDKLAQLAAAAAEAAGRQVQDQSVSVRYQNATASALTELDATVEDINGVLTAQASAITAVEASVGLISADGLFQIVASAGTGDVVSRMVAQVRATVSDAWVDAGWVMEAGFTGGNPLAPFSNFVIHADKFVVTDGTNSGAPMTFEDGQLKLLIANIGTVIAGLLKSPDDLFQITLADGKIEWFDP